MIQLGHSLKLTDRHRQGGWVDPLAGIDFIARLQMNAGDDASRGLYEDVDFLNPVTADSSVVMGATTTITDWTSESTMGSPVVTFDSGRLSMQFDGVDDRIFNTTPMNLANPTCYFVVRSAGGAAGNSNSLLSEYSSTNLFYGYNVFVPNLIFYAYAANTNASGIPSDPLTDLAVITFSKVGNTALVRHNGTQLGISTSQDSSVIPIAGLIGGANTAVPPCFMSDLIIEDSLTPSIATVEAYLANLHGITLA